MPKVTPRVSKRATPRKKAARRSTPYTPEERFMRAFMRLIPKIHAFDDALAVEDPDLAPAGPSEQAVARALVHGALGAFRLYGLAKRNGGVLVHVATGTPDTTTGRLELHYPAAPAKSTVEPIRRAS